VVEWFVGKVGLTGIYRSPIFCFIQPKIYFHLCNINDILIKTTIVSLSNTKTDTMKTIASAQRKINTVKNNLITKAKKEGLYENFGQDEISKLYDQCDPYGTPDQRTIYAMVQGLDNWAMNYDLSAMNA
jgi:hypothetical protein